MYVVTLSLPLRVGVMASGNPKGVVLSHRAFGISVGAGTRDTTPSDQDIHCSYLPLAHIFEAVVQAFISACGAKVGYFQANIKVIGQDWKVRDIIT